MLFLLYRQVRSSLGFYDANCSDGRAQSIDEKYVRSELIGEPAIKK